MSKRPKDAADFVEFLRNLPQHVKNETHEREQERALAEHRQFQAAFKASKCFMCGEALGAFAKSKPCPHWLLKPAGFTKRDFESVIAQYSCFQIQAFLRWVANEDSFARNINDLKDEGTGKVIELTIRYKDLEWSFSCAEGDLKGHKTDSSASQRPHYHFQMRANKQAFIRYNDFHIPLSDHDRIVLEAQLIAPELIQQRFTGGQGMNTVLNEDTVEKIVMTAKYGDGVQEEAPFSIDSILMADEATVLKGEDIYDAIQRAKAKGVTIASELRSIPSANLRTIVTPGPGVVEQTPRSGGRGRYKR